MSTYDVRTHWTVFFHGHRGDFIDRRCVDAWFSLTRITVEIYSGHHASIKLVAKMAQGIQNWKYDDRLKYSRSILRLGRRSVGSDLTETFEIMKNAMYALTIELFFKWMTENDQKLFKKRFKLKVPKLAFINAIELLIIETCHMYDVKIDAQ